MTYTTVTHALGAIKCTITELGVYASIYTPSYQPITLICNDVMWYKEISNDGVLCFGITAKRLLHSMQMFVFKASSTRSVFIALCHFVV